MGFIPRGLPRIRHPGESRYPESPTGFRVKHGMTAKDIRRYPAEGGGVMVDRDVRFDMPARENVKASVDIGAAYRVYRWSGIARDRTI